jgi:RNA polymerase sigma factor (sigma-70 family)
MEMPEATFQQAYPFALRAAQVRAAAAVFSGVIPLADRLDLEQEALVACWRALPRFDSARASLRTYLEVVVSSRLSSVRRAGRCQPRLQLLDDDQRHVEDGWARRIELRADVWRVLASLRASDRQVAVALLEHSPAEASRRLGVARSTIYAHIERLRIAFRAAGLGPQGARRP